MSTMSTAAITRHADILYRAWASAVPVVQLTAGAPLDLADAYRIQRELFDRRIAAGECPSGLKLGFTSRARMLAMGVEEVIVGLLSSSMRWLDGDTVEPTRLIRPRIEPEVVFRLGRDIEEDEGVETAVAAVDAVAAGLEVVDSRYADFRFDIADVVADNASAGGYVIGGWHPPSVDLTDRAVTLEVDGSVVETGSTAAILDDPWQALATGIRLARALSIPLSAGQVILAGAATAAVPFVGGTTVRAAVSGLDPVTLTLGSDSGGRDG
jgi:2-oxo-3-hexenedioate decarboxylase